MSVLHPRPGRHRVHTVHRAGAAAIGGFLVLFAVLGLAGGLAMLTTSGAVVMGLTTNGLLSVISLLVGLILIGAAVRGGHLASTISMITGIGFLVSGLGNMFVLSTRMNVLAFSLANVFFSLVVGCFLLFLGAYGRFSGALPAENPYAADAAEDDGPRPAIEGAGTDVPAQRGIRSVDSRNRRN